MHNIVWESKAPGRALAKFWERIRATREIPWDDPKDCLTPQERDELDALHNEFDNQHFECWRRIDALGVPA